MSNDHVTIFSYNNIKSATPPFKTCGQSKTLPNFCNLSPISCIKFNISVLVDHVIQLTLLSSLGKAFLHICNISLENISSHTYGNTQASALYSSWSAMLCHIWVGSYGNQHTLHVNIHRVKHSHTYTCTHTHVGTHTQLIWLIWYTSIDFTYNLNSPHNQINLFFLAGVQRQYYMTHIQSKSNYKKLINYKHNYTNTQNRN